MSAISIFIIVVAVMALGLLIVGVVDGNRFRVVNESFELPKLSKNCRFVLISDLHNKVYGNNNEKVIEAIDKIKPDFILVAGDLVTSKPTEDVAPAIEFIKELCKRYKVIYGMGNHESKMRDKKEIFGDKYDRYMKAIDNPNLTVLTNEALILPEYNITVTGLDIDYKFFVHFKVIKMERGYLQNTLPRIDESRCNIMIAHNPSYFKEYAKWGADLVVSGHVHGGIMRLPLLGGVIAPSCILFPKYDGGVFKSGKSTMLLGRGLGSHTIHLRFFNPAELYSVDLYGAN